MDYESEDKEALRNANLEMARQDFADLIETWRMQGLTWRTIAEIVTGRDNQLDGMFLGDRARAILGRHLHGERSESEVTP